MSSKKRVLGNKEFFLFETNQSNEKTIKKNLELYESKFQDFSQANSVLIKVIFDYVIVHQISIERYRAK